jgi:hypothetical protein
MVVFLFKRAKARGYECCCSYRSAALIRDATHAALRFFVALNRKIDRLCRRFSI